MLFPIAVAQEINPMRDITSSLEKMMARMEALNGKTLKPADWVQELAEEVVMLIMVCKAQQEEINRLDLKTLNPLR